MNIFRAIFVRKIIFISAKFCALAPVTPDPGDAIIGTVEYHFGDVERTSAARGDHRRLDDVQVS